MSEFNKREKIEPQNSEYLSFLRTHESIDSNEKINKKFLELREIHRKELSKLFSDFEISIGDKVFRIHRLIIACFIPIIFYKLSKICGMNDIRSIKLIGIELCAFEIILKFI